MLLFNRELQNQPCIVTGLILTYREPGTWTTESLNDGPSTNPGVRAQGKRLKNFSPMKTSLTSSVHNQLHTPILPHLSSAAGAEDRVGNLEQTPE